MSATSPMQFYLKTLDDINFFLDQINLTQDKSFRKDFIQNLSCYIFQDQRTKEIQKDNIHPIHCFLDRLLGEGYSEIEGPDEKCRPVVVTIQAALEAVLARELLTREIKKVKVLILTPCVSTPLLEIEDHLFPSFETARMHTLYQRQFTLKNLLETKGAEVHIAYSKNQYDQFKEDPKNLKVAIPYETIKKSLFDEPLDTDIPEDLIGALYEFSDWLLVVKGFQAKEAKEGTWKMYLVPASHPSLGLELANQMKDFTQRHLASNKC